VSESTALVRSRFQSVDQLFVRQQRKWFEVLFSAELKNAYEVLDEAGQPAFDFRETGAGAKEFLYRMLLGPTRPFTMSLVAADGEEVLRLDRPWKFMFHELTITDGDDNRIGRIVREWSWVRRIYAIEDASGRVIARFFGAFFRPWTFEVQSPEGAVLGAVKKKWSGLGREMFSDADNYSVDLHGISDPNLKALVVAGVALIDIVHFERRKQ
jgi:uncharacterized protein YxjI